MGAPAMGAMKAKRVAAAPAMKAMNARVVGGCAGGGCVVHACQSTSLLVTGRRCSLGAAGPGHPPSRSRGCSSEGSCCTQQFGISCECGRETAEAQTRLVYCISVCRWRIHMGRFFLCD